MGSVRRLTYTRGLYRFSVVAKVTDRRYTIAGKEFQAEEVAGSPQEARKAFLQRLSRKTGIPEHRFSAEAKMLGFVGEKPIAASAPQLDLAFV